MSEKKTLQKCKKIMQMFEKSKLRSQVKDKSTPNTSFMKVSSKQNKQNISHHRNSFYVPNRKKEYSSQKSNLKPSYNNSTTSVNSAKKSIKSTSSVSKSYSKSNFETCYNKESRYDKIMKLKVKPTIGKNKENAKNSYLNNSKVSQKSGVSADRSQSKQSRFDKIMKLKVYKPRADSTLKNYQPPKEERKILFKQNVDYNSIVELKKCKESMKKQQRQVEKQERLWKVFQRQRQLRLKQKQKKQKNDYQKQRSLEKRFDVLVQKELKKIQLQKELQERREEGFSTYLFPSY